MTNNIKFPVHMDFLLALKIGRFYHQGQKYSVNDYFDYHVLGVVNSIQEPNTLYKIVAILHDVLEDTKCPDDLILDCFGEVVYGAVVALTRNHHLRHSPDVPRETYDDYIERMLKNPVACVVKLHDSSFNMMECVKEGRFGKAAKYAKVISLLADRIGGNVVRI